MSEPHTADFDNALNVLRAAQTTLEEALRDKEWIQALQACNQLSAALVVLGRHLDAMTDDGRHNQIVEIYNHAVEQHNEAINTIADAGELPGWRIDDVQPCGCPVEPISVPCERHEAEWGQAQTDCGDCRYGVPGVRHWNNGCEVGQ